MSLRHYASAYTNMNSFQANQRRCKTRTSKLTMVDRGAISLSGPVHVQAIHFDAFFLTNEKEVSLVWKFLSSRKSQESTSKTNCDHLNSCQSYLVIVIIKLFIHRCNTIPAHFRVDCAQTCLFNEAFILLSLSLLNTSSLDCCCFRWRCDYCLSLLFYDSTYCTTSWAYK